MATNYNLLPRGLGTSMNYGSNAPNLLLDGARGDINMFNPNYIQSAISPDAAASSGIDYALKGGYNNPMGETGFKIGALGSQSGSGSGLGMFGSALGVINPVAGLAMGIGGTIADYQEAKRAEAIQEQQMDDLRSSRDFSRQRYISELDDDAARRGMIQRGQVANTPAYQAMMNNLTRQNAAATQVNTDQMQKQGLGNKSGMSAQLASQNLSNLGKATTLGSAQQMGNLGRVYGGLGPYAMTTKPEGLELQRQQGRYNEASDYGSNLAPFFQMGSSATKGMIGDAYRGQMRDDISAGFGLGRTGGNV